MINQKSILLSSVGFVLALGMGAAMAQDHDSHAGHDHGAESTDDHGIQLTAKDILDFGIQTAPVGPGELILTVELPAEIHPNDDRLAHIVPRYEGLVTEVFVQVGDQVKVGETLANIEGDASLSVFPLKTRIAGTVISKHITRGEAVSRDSRPFVIADLSTVWLDIHVFQRDLLRVTEGQNVRLISGPEKTSTSGTISYVSPVLDESTRTAVARAVLDNSQGHFRPGMFVTAVVEVEKRKADLIIPLTALFTMHDHPAVFIEGPHGFETREITTGLSDENSIAVLSGLQSGDRVVIQGGFTLKAELEKSTFGDGHNH